MKILKICRVSADLRSTSDKVGWHVRRSVNVKDIVPEWRLAGGGVCRDELTKDLEEALDTAIEYTEQHIENADRHLKRLLRAKKGLKP